MRYFVHDPMSPTGWRGPFDEHLVRQAVGDGHIAPTWLVCADQAGAQPIMAGNIPQTASTSSPLEGLLKAAAIVGVGVLGGWALASVANALAGGQADPEPKAIRKSARRHEKKGAVVLADVEGYLRPPKINGHIPDVYAVYEDGVVVEEFENERSVVGTHARRQDAAFSTWARRSYRRQYTQVVVPGGRGGRR